MGLSRLASKCRACPFAVKCTHKQMEALAYLPEPHTAPMLAATTESVAMPGLRETQTIYIEGKPTIVYKDEIEKALYASMDLFRYNLMGGA